MNVTEKKISHQCRRARKVRTPMKRDVTIAINTDIEQAVDRSQRDLLVLASHVHPRSAKHVTAQSGRRVSGKSSEQTQQAEIGEAAAR